MDAKVAGEPYSLQGQQLFLWFQALDCFIPIYFMALFSKATRPVQVSYIPAYNVVDREGLF